MTLNPLAVELNEVIKAEAPGVFDMLSELGKRYYFPRGILSQSAEAKAKAKRFNATVGIALEGHQAMHLDCIQQHLKSFDPKDLYPYAAPAGKPELRKAWRDKQLEENPRMREVELGAPVATNALTHGLSLVGELFVDPGDTILLPDQIWGNYNLTYGVRCGASIEKFPFFEGEGINLEGFCEAVKRLSGTLDKLIVILNFPNNPTGYTPTPAEAEAIAAALKAAADDCRIVAICDDAYFNLVYDDRCLTESIFGYLAGQHENLLAIRLDGATKELFVWGFRVGFLTYAVTSGGDVGKVHEALEKKTAGAIRGGISNSPHLSQTLVLAALNSPTCRQEQAAKCEVLRVRAIRAKEVLADPKYASAWEPYPFNSGYFMCLKLKSVDAETLRVHLLDQYGLGVIATSATDIRVAFSCLEVDQVATVYEDIYKGVCDLS